MKTFSQVVLSRIADWIQGSKNFHGVRDQDLKQFWDQGSKFKVEMWNQARETIPRYDPDDGACYRNRKPEAKDFEKV